MSLIEPLNKGLRVLRTIQSCEHIEPNLDGTSYRLSSAAFKAGSDKTFSVDIEESQLRAGVPLESGYPRVPRAVALVAHTVEEYEKNDFGVCHDPIPENDHHGSAVTVLKNQAARRAARALCESARFVVAIDHALAVAYGAKPLTRAASPTQHQSTDLKS